MIRPSILAILLLCAVCSFCGKDFVTLGRHSWRCKQRVNYANENGSENSTSREVPDASSPTVVIPNRTVIKCCCGKICKGARGLKMHQRSCHVIHSLNNELCADLEEQITDADNNAQMNDEISTNSTLA